MGAAPATRRRRNPWLAALAAALVVGLATLPAAAAPTPAPTPTAPRPTSTAASPEAPDPRPPAGGGGPGGLVPGGEGLASRGLVAPRGAPAPPTVTARAWAVVDLDAGTVVAARDAHGRYQPASILKTLAALVLLPRLPAQRKVAISQAAADTEGSAVGLVPGGDYTTDILFQAMLLMSGNDATEALAEAAGGDATTVAAMNRTVRGLGGFDTVVQTPTGLDGWSQLTSAYDMALVLRAAVADRRLLGYDTVRRAFLPAQQLPKNGEKVGTIELGNQSVDYLDGVPGAMFAKTGFTDAARHTFLAAARQGGRTLGVVLLRAERTPVDQWQQAAQLMRWAGDARVRAANPVGTLDTAEDLDARAAASAASSSSPDPTGTTTPAPAGSAVAADVRTARTDGGFRVPPGYLGLAGLLVVVAIAARSRARRRRRR